MSFEVNIHMTSKNNTKDEEYIGYDNESQIFGTLEEAKDFIKERYPKKPKTYMYQDKKDGSTIRIGWIFGFWNEDNYQGGSNTKWLQEDWVSINQVVVKPVEV